LIFFDPIWTNFVKFNRFWTDLIQSDPKLFQFATSSIYFTNVVLANIKSEQIFFKVQTKHKHDKWLEALLLKIIWLYRLIKFWQNQMLILCLSYSITTVLNSFSNLISSSTSSTVPSTTVSSPVPNYRSLERIKNGTSGSSSSTSGVGNYDNGSNSTSGKSSTSSYLSSTTPSRFSRNSDSTSGYSSSRHESTSSPFGLARRDSSTSSYLR
jgi:hypothetical protein